MKYGTETLRYFGDWPMMQRIHRLPRWAVTRVLSVGSATNLRASLPTSALELRLPRWSRLPQSVDRISSQWQSFFADFRVKSTDSRGRGVCIYAWESILLRIVDSNSRFVAAVLSHDANLKHIPESGAQCSFRLSLCFNTSEMMPQMRPRH